ncbi:MAG: MerR family DNA-binding transcriptional regulator [Cyanobium sp.]
MESQVVAQQLVQVPAQALDRIGAVAARSGVSVKTIRFYCDQGLLRPSGRPCCRSPQPGPRQPRQPQP